MTCHFWWKALAITPRPDLYMPMVFGSNDIYSSDVQRVESEVMGSMRMCGLVYFENRGGGGGVLHIHDTFSFFSFLFFILPDLLFHIYGADKTAKRVLWPPLFSVFGKLHICLFRLWPP